MGVCCEKKMMIWYKCLKYKVEGPQTKRKTKEDLERGCGKRLMHVN